MVRRGLGLGLGRRAEAVSPAEAATAEIDLEAFNKHELAVLLANLERSGRSQLADVIERRLEHLPRRRAAEFADAMSGSAVDTGPGEPGVLGGTRTAVATAGALALAALAALVVFSASRPGHRAAPDGGAAAIQQASQMSPARGPAVAPPSAAPQTAPASGSGRPKVATTVARRWDKQMLPTPRAPPALAAAPPHPAPDRSADVVALAAAAPGPDAAAPPTAPSTAAPLVVVHGEVGLLLGRAPGRSDPLRSLAGGNPVRMATALSGPR